MPRVSSLVECGRGRTARRPGAAVCLQNLCAQQILELISTNVSRTRHHPVSTVLPPSPSALWALRARGGTQMPSVPKPRRAVCLHSARALAGHRVPEGWHEAHEGS